MTRRVLFGAHALLTLAYLAWRGACTIDPDARLWSWTFLLLESYAAVCCFLFYATVLDCRPRNVPPARAGLRIDVLVCTYNEPLALVRQTLRCALALHHPHRTWLLDDGNRGAARALAEELGCGYLAREHNTDYKAGNLNNALARTDGDLVVVLDADHLLRPEFLGRLVGYFDDPQVALVQVPQVFYNVDSFQHHLDTRRGRLWHEGAIFHHAIQPGADRWNAALFVGTGAILRRSALERIGGFAVGTVTEDAHTSLRLHAAGYRSVYHDEPLGYLQAPQSLLQYLTQRLRWGQGSMQILRRENPLWKPGLSLLQRLVYWNALSSFAQAVVHLAYYLAPALFLLGFPAPLRVQRPVEFTPIVGRVALDLLVFRVMLGPLARPLLSECYKFLNVYVYLKALAGLFSRKRLRFEVTTKGRDAAAPRKLLAPQIFLLLLNATGFAAGILRLSGGGTLVGQLGVAVATFFAGLFVVIGGTATLFALHRIAARSEYTFPDHLPVILADTVGAASLLRANASELQVLASFVGPRPAPGASVSVSLPLAGSALQLTGRLAAVDRVRAAPQGAEGAVLRIALDPLPPRAADLLFDRFVRHSMPRVVDPLSRGASEALPAFYLPLEPNVL
jgi:cellulose synthase (UDP-forming)